MISNCGHDEHGRYSGGQAGDQTGQEWAVIPWYSRPWNVVLRHPDRDTAQLIADMARSAAKNDNIGYDQSQRYTYWTALKRAEYNPAKITELCEADCSSGVAANVKAAGYKTGDKALQGVSIYAYTGNLRKQLQSAGFDALYAEKYLTSDKYLLPGDILLYEGHHVATNLDSGSSAGTEGKMPEEFPHWAQSGADWYYRIAEGTNLHGWNVINHHWYYFGADGKMLKGWFQVDGRWYYSQPDGELEGALYHTDRNGAQDIWYVD